MHDAVRPVKPCVLREEIDKGTGQHPSPSRKPNRHAHIHRRAARFPHFQNNGGGRGIDKGRDGGEFNLVFNGGGCRFALGEPPRLHLIRRPFPQRPMDGPYNQKIAHNDNRGERKIRHQRLSYGYRRSKYIYGGIHTLSVKRIKPLRKCVFFGVA